MADKLEDLFKALSLEEMNELLPRLVAIRSEAAEVMRADLRARLKALDNLDLRPAKPTKSGDGRSSPKVTHRGPNGETWKGKGVKPKWLQALIDKGKKADDYRV